MNNNKDNSFLSFSLAKGFTCPNIPIGTFYQGDKELNFIIDTGSNENVLSKEALNGLEYKKIEHNGTLSGVGGVYQVEACNLSFQNEKETFTAKFLISDNLKEAFQNIRKSHGISLHGMLGSSFLMKYHIVLDFEKMTAYNEKR